MFTVLSDFDLYLYCILYRSLLIGVILSLTKYCENVKIDFLKLVKIVQLIFLNSLEFFAIFCILYYEGNFFKRGF